MEQKKTARGYCDYRGLMAADSLYTGAKPDTHEETRMVKRMQDLIG